LKRILQVASIAILTIVFLALFLWNSNLSDVWRIMKAANPAWLVTGCLVNASALVFRSIRWRILLDRQSPPSFYATFFANTIGYGLSATLPIRAGDVARPALLSRRSNIRFSAALGTVVTERLLDMVSILSLLLFFCVLRWNELDDAVIHGTAVGAVTIVAAVIVFTLGAYFFRHAFRAVHVRIGNLLPARLREPWMRIFDAFARTLELAETPAAAIAVVASTAAIWFCLTAQYWCVFFAMRRAVPLDASLFINAAGTVGVAIPTPGGVGGFHKIVQWVLTSYYGFDVDTSVAAAVLLHVVGTLPVLVIGVVLMLREGVTWRELSRETTSDET
jgi:uncharacterized protein (TIRG00374 family)